MMSQAATAPRAKPQPRGKATMARTRQPPPELVGVLMAQFPAAFNESRPPLKIGIDADIRARLPEVDRLTLAAALRFWTTRRGYLEHVAKLQTRVDLDGQPCGQPTLDHVRGAWQFLSKLWPREFKPGGDLDPRRRVPAYVAGHAILHSAPLDTDLPDEAFATIRALLDQHPAAATKQAGGLRAIQVREVKGHRAFVAVRNDGTVDDFSLLKCIPMPQGKRNVSAPAARPPAITCTVPVKAAKLSISIRSEQFPRLRLADQQQTVRLSFVSGPVVLHAALPAKSYNRALRSMGGAGTYVVVQGKLARNNVVSEPGIMVQAPK